jgi:hypothetical protein
MYRKWIVIVGIVGLALLSGCQTTGEAVNLGDLVEKKKTDLCSVFDGVSLDACLCAAATEEACGKAGNCVITNLGLRPTNREQAVAAIDAEFGSFDQKEAEASAACYSYQSMLVSSTEEAALQFLMDKYGEEQAFTLFDLYVAPNLAVVEAEAS